MHCHTAIERPTSIVLLTAALLASVLPSSALAASCHAASAVTTTPLYELYTSEGCSSCPPADRWLAAHFPSQPAAGAPIALAFHVDYWDSLGWKDRFASADYTARQHASMEANHEGFVYTPQVLLQGKSLTRWHDIDPVAAARKIAETPAAARITLDASTTAARVDVRVEAANQSARNARLFIAYADNDLSSQVKAGENRGVRLQHEHVVRALHDAITIAAGTTRQAQVALDLPSERGKLPAVVAFVQDSASGQVLQALSVPLDGCAMAP